MTLIEQRDDRSEKVHYDDPDYPIYIHRALLSSYPGFTAPAHWHDDIELIAVLSGEMQYNVNGELISLRENEGIFVNARQMHFGFSETRTECDFLCILLHPLLLCTTAAYERNFVLPVLHNSDVAFVKLNRSLPWQWDILEAVGQMYAVSEAPAAPLKVQALFLGIWTQLFENSIQASPPKRQSADLSVLKNMIGFIQQNYPQKITLSRIAASGAVGQSKCCKLFARYTNSTPNAYLMQYRLDKSTALLRNTDMTVTEIAQTVGFSGSSYYAEAFRKWSGLSPSAYRKAQRSS